MKWQQVAAVLAIILLGAGAVTYTDLFGALFELEGMNYTFTGDQNCGTTCESYINVTTTYWRVCFDHYNGTKYENETLFKKVSRSRTLHVNLANVDNVITTEPRVEVDWMVPARGAGNWRPLADGDCWDRGQVNKIKLVGHKEFSDTIKWSFLMDEYVDIDPTWNGYDFGPYLVAAWTCDDDSGDEYFSNNDGINYGGTEITGHLDGALNFSSSDGGFLVSDNADDPFDALNNLTVIFWAKPTDTYVSSTVGTGMIAKLSNAWNLRFEFQWNDNFRSTTNAATAKNTNSANDAIIDGAWHMYSYSFKDGNTSLFLDDTLLVTEDNEDTTGTIADATSSLFIAIDDDNSTLQYEGGLDNIMIFDMTMNLTHITAIYNSGTGTLPSDIADLVTCDLSSDTTISAALDCTGDTFTVTNGALVRVEALVTADEVYVPDGTIYIPEGEGGSIYVTS